MSEYVVGYIYIVKAQKWRRSISSYRANVDNKASSLVNKTKD